MKYWGTVFIASAFAASLYTSALAEPQVPTAGIAMPMPIHDDFDKATQKARVPQATSGDRVLSLTETEKARMNVDMDQTREKLESRLSELKTTAKQTKGFAHFRMGQKINKLKGERSSIKKMYRQVSKVSDKNLSHTQKDWEKLKKYIDYQISIAE